MGLSRLRQLKQRHRDGEIPCEPLKEDFPCEMDLSLFLKNGSTCFQPHPRRPESCHALYSPGTERVYTRPLIIEEPPRALPVTMGRSLPPSAVRGGECHLYTGASRPVKLLDINGTRAVQAFTTGPRSRSSTLVLGFSLRREATTQPAVPPRAFVTWPTTTCKENVGSPPMTM